MERSTNRRSEMLSLLGALLVGLALRLHGIDAALNHDEAYTLEVFASRPYAEIATSYPVPNNHILHSLLVRFAVQLGGEAEWVVRLPALLAGLLAIPLVRALCRRLDALRVVAGMGAWLLALAPVHVAYSQMARGYSLLVLFSLLALLGVWLALDGSRGWWVGYVCCGFLGAYSVPSGVFNLVALGIWAGLVCALRRSWRTLGELAAASLLLALCVGAAYWPIRDELMHAGSRWGVVLEGDSGRILGVVETASALCAGGWAGLGPGLLGVFGLWTLGRRNDPLAWFAGLVWCLPFMLGLGAGIVGQPRTYLFLLIPFVLLATAGLASVVEWSGRRWSVRVGAVLMALAGYGWVNIGQLTRPVDRSFRELGKFLDGAIAPGDVVIAPFIVDMQLAHYAGGAIHRGLQGAIDQGAIGRLLFVTREGDPRFRLESYLLRLNLVADEEDYQRSLSFPAEAYESLFSAGDLGVRRLRGAGQRVFRAAGEKWRISRLEGGGKVRLEEVAPAWSERSGLAIENRSGGRIALQARRSFAATSDGLVVLTWARTERDRTSASLYVEEVGAGGAERTPLQMFRTGQPLQGRGRDGNDWFLEGFLLPVEGNKRYGVYLLTWEVERQEIADLACFFFSYGP